MWFISNIINFLNSWWNVLFLSRSNGCLTFYYLSLKYFNLLGYLSIKRMRIEIFVGIDSSIRLLFFKMKTNPGVYTNLTLIFKLIAVVRNAKTWNIKGRAAPEKKAAWSSDGWTSEEARSSWNCISGGCFTEKWWIWKPVYSSTK